MKRCKDGRLHFDEATWDPEFSYDKIPRILSAHQIIEETLERDIEKELDEALLILKDKITWRDDLSRGFDKFYENSNVLLNLEKPVMTLI